MRRNEVLQHVEAFAEVGRDRCLDDRAIRLGHQAAHAGKLPNLRGGTTGTGVGHHVDRVERLLLDELAGRVLDLVRPEFVHHRLRHLVVGARPDVDDLVVAFAVGYQTGRVLVLYLLHFSLGYGKNIRLALGDDHVVDADRNAGNRGHAEARVHQLVGKHDRLLEAELAVAGIDDVGNRLFRHRPVDQLEVEACGQNFGQQRAPDCRRDKLLDRSLLAGIFVDLVGRHTDADFGLQFGSTALEGATRLVDVGEHHALARAVNALARHVIQTEYDVLRRHDDRVAVGR